MILTGSRRIIANTSPNIPEGQTPAAFAKIIGNVPRTGSVSDKRDALWQAARDHGLNFQQNEVRKGRDMGQYEHHVHLNDAGDRVFKLSKKTGAGDFGLHRDVHSYVQNLHNLGGLAPDLDIKIHGVSLDDEGHPSIVSSARKIEGTHPSEEELHAHLKDSGWKRDAFSKWRDPDSGATLGDAHRGNWIKTHTGKFIPIDVHYNPSEQHAPSEQHIHSPENSSQLLPDRQLSPSEQHMHSGFSSPRKFEPFTGWLDSK